MIGLVIGSFFPLFPHRQNTHQSFVFYRLVLHSQTESPPPPRFSILTGVSKCSVCFSSEDVGDVWGTWALCQFLGTQSVKQM